MSTVTKRLTRIGTTGVAVVALAVPTLSLSSFTSPAAAAAVRHVSATAAAAAADTTAAHPVPKVRKLTGTVGPSFEISMSRSRTVRGMYDITVRDRSNAHNFHLTGPGVDKKTLVGRTVTKVWHVRLRVGTYRFQCDIHPTQMFGRIRVVAPQR
jgi:plastocyanin